MSRQQQIWWCAQCQERYRSELPVAAVTCKRGHRMKQVESEAEIARENAREGVK